MGRWKLTRNQYKAGIIDDLSVAVIEATALSAERNAVGMMGNWLIASVRLVAGLDGGRKGMTTGDMAGRRSMMPDATNAAP